MSEDLVEELGELVDQVQALMDQAEQDLYIGLNEKRLATVRRLYAQCTICDSTSETGLPSVSKKRKITPSNELIVGGPKDPWKRITNMTQLPALSEYIAGHIAKYPTQDDTEKFLRTLALTSNCGDYSSKDDLGNAFMARYTWTQRVERRNEQTQLLQLFNDLFWFDMMQLLRPKGTGRVGGAMRDELDRFLTPLNFQRMNLEKDAVIANVGDWSIRGAKINILCNMFGPSVILVLYRELSRHFLESRFTASGRYYKGAVHKLKVLGLEGYGERTGATELAGNVRMLLIKPFQEAYRQVAQD